MSKTSLNEIQHNFYQIPAAFLAEIDNLLLKFIWKRKGSRIAKTILRKKNKVGPTLLNFKTYYKSYSKQVWVELA